MFIGAAAILSVKLGLGQSQDLIIIGCVMPLVPGVQITNALRDLLAGHYLSGVSRGTEALMTSGMIVLALLLSFNFSIKRSDLLARNRFGTIYL